MVSFLCRQLYQATVLDKGNEIVLAFHQEVMAKELKCQSMASAVARGGYIHDSTAGKVFTCSFLAFGTNIGMLAFMKRFEAIWGRFFIKHQLSYINSGRQLYIDSLKSQDLSTGVVRENCDKGKGIRAQKAVTFAAESDLEVNVGSDSEGNIYSPIEDTIDGDIEGTIDSDVEGTVPSDAGDVKGNVDGN